MAGQQMQGSLCASSLHTFQWTSKAPFKFKRIHQNSLKVCDPMKGAAFLAVAKGHKGRADATENMEPLTSCPDIHRLFCTMLPPGQVAALRTALLSIIYPVITLQQVLYK